MSGRSILQNIKEVWLISWPLIVASSFWNIQITIDRMFLGHFSTEGLGAAMAASAVFWAPMALVQQTSAYVTTFVAQYSGAKKKTFIGPSLWHALYASVIGGLLFLLLIPLSPFIFQWMGHSELLQTMESEYFSALCYSALPTAIVAACSGFYTGIERSRMVMVINGAGLFANVLFDYFLIFGHGGFPALGMVGAGLATAAANYCAAMVGLYLIFSQLKNDTYNLKQGWRFNGDLMGRFFRFGIPSGMQWALEGLAFTVFLAILGRLPHGAVALSASSIAITLLMLAILPVQGVAQGVSALVGVHLGENRVPGAVSATWAGIQLSMVYIAVIALSFLLMPDFYLVFFKGQQVSAAVWTAVAELTPYLMMFVAFSIVFDSLNMVFSYTLKGAGDTRFVSLVALVLPWPLMVLPTWLVQDWPSGVFWAWGSACLYVCLQAVVFIARFLQGKWKAMRVI